MDFATFVAVWLSIAALLIFLLLFGESPSFIGTPIASAHWLLTQGIWEGVGWAIERVCGQRGTRMVEAVLECCCDRPNPTLQISYLLLMGGCYWLYVTNVFVLLPPGSVHAVTGTLSFITSLAWFVAACRSDPGTVTHANVQAHRTLYACDGHIWPEKRCVTCSFMRPARSKHCRVCNRCVARHDHHCGWINNCVGLANLRIFLGFLAAHICMTMYGSVLGGSLLMAQADRVGIRKHRVMDWVTRTVQVVHTPLQSVLQWMVVMFPVASALTLFMAMATLLLLAFTAYQLYLLAQGKTQYEVYRWRELRVQMMQEHAEQQQQQQPVVMGQGVERSTGAQGTVPQSSMQQGKGQGKQAAAGKAPPVLPRNSYNRGLWWNAYEVLFPAASLAKPKTS